MEYDHKDRTPRRQRLAAHLHAAGPRPTFEALLEVASGRPLDAVLEAYARIPVAIYHAVGADEMSISQLMVVNGGRS